MSDKEAKALLSIVSASGEPYGKKWASQRYGWNIEENEVPVCDWEGIDCVNMEDGEDHVVNVNLTRTDVTSYIPTEFGLLSYLQILDLSHNQMYGTIPNEIQSNLIHLQIINLSDNHFDGSVPTFTSSNSITNLLLKENDFDGTIPTSFYINKRLLNELSLMGNTFTGTISEAIGQLTNLETLELSSNSFSGTIPLSLAVLDNLKYLYVDNNSLVGTIPSDLIRKESNLKEVWLQGNLLSGLVPPAFGSMDLDDLYIDGNKFVGDLPSDLCQPGINADFFKDVYTNNNENSITTYTAAGEIKEGKDYCQTIACPENTYSIEGVWPCKPCEKGTTSPYLGTEETCFPRNQEEILRQLYQDTGGEDWTNNNWFRSSKGVPPDICTFTGIICTDGHVSEIHLKAMNLNGRIPESLGFLQHLHVLDVSDNELSSYLPSDLRFAPLTTLDVSGNHIKGIVPPLLCSDGNINGNGLNGKFQCDYIACPPGTSSSLGRATPDGKVQCEKCNDEEFFNILGRKHCSSLKKSGGSGSMYGAFAEDGLSPTITNSTASSASAGRVFGVLLMLAIVVVTMYYVFRAVWKRYMQTKEHVVLEMDLASMRVPTAWSFTNREVC